jgi:protocatechuate 3,4-dioxygenase beta subunit
LARTQSLSNLRIALTPEAFLSGKLVDQDGFPVQGASVNAWRYEAAGGERKLQRMGGGESDDLGQFHFRVRPGRYCLSVNPRDLSQWDGRYTAQYVPGGFQPDDAHAIEVAAGQNYVVPELTVKQLPTVTVTGRAVMPDGTPGRQQVLARLTPASSDPLQGQISASVDSRDGSFVFRHVPPGTYTLVASSSQPRAPKAGDFQITRQVAAASADVDTGVLTLQELRAVDLAGTVVMADGSALQPAMVSLRAGAGLQATASLKADGTFVFKGLLPGHYDSVVMRGEPARIAPRAISAKLGDREVLRSGFDLDGTPGEPLRIVVSLNGIAVRGRLVDRNAMPLANAAVEFTDSQSGPQYTAGTDADGWFSLHVFMPGTYHVLAIADSGKSNLFHDPDYVGAHWNDFPPVQIGAAQAGPLVLTMPGK